MKSHLILLILLVLTSCNVLTPVKDAAVYHVLDPLVPDRELSQSSPSMAINRPSIPGYLDRQQQVTRSGGELMISSINLWGEPLDSAIARVMASNLSRLNGSSNIQPVENFSALGYSTLLELRISRFEPDVSNLMILEGTWKLQPVKGGEARSHFYRITVAILTGSSPAAARVVAMNQCLEILARQVANQSG